MIFSNATFITSCYSLSSLPDDLGAELVFLGRSNVGKSTLINKICGKKLLARTSKTPGRTQCLNVYDLGERMRLVDAPGYGFAKVPEHVKKAWQVLVTQYCETRVSLRLVVLVMDIRHPLQPADIIWLNALGGGPIALLIVLNKADCLGRMQQAKSQKMVEKYCREHVSPTKIFCVSARDGSDIDGLRQYMVDSLLADQL